jgi:hypothetical protein
VLNLANGESPLHIKLFVNQFVHRSSSTALRNLQHCNLEFSTLDDEYSTTGAALLIIQCHTSQPRQTLLGLMMLISPSSQCVFCADLALDAEFHPIT